MTYSETNILKILIYIAYTLLLYWKQVHTYQKQLETKIYWVRKNVKCLGRVFLGISHFTRECAFKHTPQMCCSIVSKNYCISFNIRLLSVLIAEWLECHAGERGVAGSNPGGDMRHHFEFFRLLSVDHSSANIIQMKSSMTFIQSNWWTEIDLLLKQIWPRFIWWQVSFKDKIVVYNLVPTSHRTTKLNTLIGYITLAMDSNGGT